VEMMSTAITNNPFFEENGYYVVKNLYDPSLLIDSLPKEKGKIVYYNGVNEYQVFEGEQVKGAVARYRHPKYKTAHNDIRLKLQDIIGKPLYNTYYYDRFYSPGQILDKHIDRPSCEISVSVHISSNLKDSWPFCITTPEGVDAKLSLNPGDGILYKGCERPHWRESMPGVKRNIIRRLFGMKSLYYHQIFFHYVLANGIYAHFANDTGS
jgi:hypothetical protein